MNTIKNLTAREILDSRGNPTIETTVFLDNGILAGFAVPSGASKGAYEAVELRDSEKSRYFGKGVNKALRIINEKIKPLILNINIENQSEIDNLMIKADGNDNKSNFGANSILSVSLSCIRAAALSLNLPLYKYINQITGLNNSNAKSVVPMFNIINGGLHGSNENLTIQEFLLVPRLDAPFSKKLQSGVEIYLNLKKILIENHYSTALGDEGGFSPGIASNDAALDFIRQAIEKSGDIFNNEIYIGLDMAATTYFRNGKYKDLYTPSSFIKPQAYSRQVMHLTDKYKLISLEDPYAEDDWDSWADFTKKRGKDVLIIGDDLLVTNINRLSKAIEISACNAILIKPNQIGTFTETIQVIKKAKTANMKIIISHRSGETNDDFIADLAIGVDADYVKFGAPARGERVAKYNRLLEIYSQLV